MLVLLALLTLGCASRQVQTLAELPLPATPAGNCCWQAVQQLEIHYGEQDYRLTGALAQTKTGATLVLLDPLGRRLLSVQQQGGQLQRWRAPELPEGLSEHFLLASSMLVWWPLADWQAALPASSPWQIRRAGDQRILNHNGDPIISASYGADTRALEQGMHGKIIEKTEPVVLRHLHQPLSINIATERLELLP
ncbi:MAG TPA: DUF3261 domain-containing protein [Chitinolyticbacter sp.]|nr:DUF3261 domain-containing protein [Chitinolyticbacter sp.]